MLTNIFAVVLAGSYVWMASYLPAGKTLESVRWMSWVYEAPLNNICRLGLNSSPTLQQRWLLRAFHSHPIYTSSSIYVRLAGPSLLYRHLVFWTVILPWFWRWWAWHYAVSFKRFGWTSSSSFCHWVWHSDPLASIYARVTENRKIDASSGPVDLD